MNRTAPSCHTNQAVDDQPLRCVIRQVENEAQNVYRKTLAEHGRRLQRLLVRGIQPIQPCLDEALHGARHTGDAGVVLGVTQQLLQEQRIARGAFDAPRGKLVRRAEAPLGHRHRLLAPERAEVDGPERSAARPALPSLVELVALDARGQDQDRRTLSHNGGQLGQMRKRRAVGPMQVLDDEQPRLFSACSLRGSGRGCVACREFATGYPSHRIGRAAPWAAEKREGR